MKPFRTVLASIAVIFLTGAAFAQGTSVPFGAISGENGLPVEISADTLSVDQSDGSAVFEGNVVVAQGSLAISAGKLRVEYAADGEDAGSGIARLIATGGVVLAAGTETAEAEEAIYDLSGNRVSLSGDVLLATGNSALSAESAEIDLNSGKAILSGRGRTILQAGDN